LFFAGNYEWAHTLAVEVHLRPVLIELGATVPARGLYVTEPELTDVDAAYLTRSRPDLDVLHDLLLRVSRLADDLPEVTELDLDLGGAAVINARVKVEPYQPQDPYLRKLR